MRNRLQRVRRGLSTLACVGALAPGLAACASTAGSSGSGGNGDSGRRVTRADFGKSWPLKVDSGTLMCDGKDGFGDAYIVVDGQKYALNGLAKGSHKYMDIRPIWANDKALGPGLKKDIGPLIDAALELCK